MTSISACASFAGDPVSQPAQHTKVPCMAHCTNVTRQHHADSRDIVRRLGPRNQVELVILVVEPATGKR